MAQQTRTPALIVNRSAHGGYMNENETTATESAIHRQDSYNRKLNQFNVCSMH